MNEVRLGVQHRPRAKTVASSTEEKTVVRHSTLREEKERRGLTSSHIDEGLFSTRPTTPTFPMFEPPPPCSNFGTAILPHVHARVHKCRHDGCGVI